MSLGVLKTDWNLVYATSGPHKRDVTEAHVATVGIPAAQQYFMKNPGNVYTPKKTFADADVIISCDKDFFSIKPDGALFKAFKKGKGDMGYVVEAKGQLALYDPTGGLGLKPLKSNVVTTVHGGKAYELVGDYNGKSVYARMDTTAIKETKVGGKLSDSDLKVYENSMQKGVIPSGSTGSDGIKSEGGDQWVIKITISIATANGMDNTLSPLADGVTEGSQIFLNFDKLAYRH